MILGQSDPQHMTMVAKAGRTTLDDLFRRAAERRPDAIALIDPDNRESVTDGAPRRLTYAEADRMISAIASRFHLMGLQTDHIVALQMANTIDAVLTFMAVLRAGLIAAPMPLLWRQSDIIEALTRIGGHALVVSGRIGSVDHCDIAITVATELFQIRHVCGFGADLPDGVVGFDDLYDADHMDLSPPVERPTNPGAHVAVVTFDVAADGLVPVARSHFELIAAGVGVVLESRLEQDATIMGALTLPSLAGLSMTLMPWLLSGGTLTLHHPFDAEAFARQCRSDRCGTIVVPGPVAFRLADAGLLTRRNGAKTVLAAWRNPERLAAAPFWTDPAIAYVDVQAFGETAVVAGLRRWNGRPLQLGLGAIAAPRDSASPVNVAEINVTKGGDIAFRGMMVPKFAFPPGSERGDMPCLRVDRDGFVDTGYPCKVDRFAKSLVVTAAPDGIVGYGGYRFALTRLQELASGIDSGTTLTAVADPLGGQRLTGMTIAPKTVQDELEKIGINPLVVAAFHDIPVDDQRAAS
jgi:hypothetical protein